MAARKYGGMRYFVGFHHPGGPDWRIIQPDFLPEFLATAGAEGWDVLDVQPVIGEQGERQALARFTEMQKGAQP